MIFFQQVHCTSSVVVPGVQRSTSSQLGNGCFLSCIYRARTIARISSANKWVRKSTNCIVRCSLWCTLDMTARKTKLVITHLKILYWLDTPWVPSWPTFWNKHEVGSSSFQECWKSASCCSNSWKCEIQTCLIIIQSMGIIVRSRVRTFHKCKCFT